MHLHPRAHVDYIMHSSSFTGAYPSLGCCAPMMFMCEQGGSWSPLGAAELYREGSCCWRCVALTTLMILGHFPVSPDQQTVVVSTLRPMNRINEFNDRAIELRTKKHRQKFWMRLYIRKLFDVNACVVDQPWSIIEALVLCALLEVEKAQAMRLSHGSGIWNQKRGKERALVQIRRKR